METMRILCIDDDRDIQTITALALGLDAAIEVRSVTSGAEGIALLRKGEWMPDAVLLDVMMPGIDGPAALAAIRSVEGASSLPVIFMTARARKADVDAYISLGATGVIVKPFDPLCLAGQVRALINGRP